MSAIIYSVLPGSFAEKYGITPGMIINKINGEDVNDILEYRFLISERSVKLELETQDGSVKKIHIRNNYEDLGIDFENPLIDKARSCRNKCIFCFIDQLPKGMRDTLYFKDDDSRLSFLHGNYVTLTNMTMEDVKRLAKIRISPINISVQTTNPELRCKMLNNRFAGDLMDKMRYLAKHRITMNCQLVLCPGINDGEEMRKSLYDLAKLFPQTASVSVVPVGISKFRDGLYPLEGYTEETSRGVLEIVSELQKEFLDSLGSRFVYAADEFYIKAGYNIPDAKEYEGFPQIENGVGMVASFAEDLSAALELQEKRAVNDELSIVCGTAVSDYMMRFAQQCMNKFSGLKINVYPIINDFFGHSITVTGLLTAGDIINQIKGKNLGSRLIISKNMLKADEDIFLDDVTLEEFERIVGVKVTPVSDDAFEFLDILLNTENNL